MMEGFLTQPLFVALRFGKWDDVRKTEDPGPKLPLYRIPLTSCRIPSGLPFWTTNTLSWILHTAFASHVAN